uniref:Putative formate dehydrogenase 2 n=1 Tax=Lygus hesperus TaxID=30085 RepID=A0A0A9WWV4_LYGHE
MPATVDKDIVYYLSYSSHNDTPDSILCNTHTTTGSPDRSKDARPGKFGHSTDRSGTAQWNAEQLKRKQKREQQQEQEQIDTVNSQMRSSWKETAAASKPHNGDGSSVGVVTEIQDALAGDDDYSMHIPLYQDVRTLLPHVVSKESVAGAKLTPQE